MTQPLRFAIAGFGKIARDQHVPAIAITPELELVAVADPRGGPEGLPHYASLDEMLAARPEIDAVALCTPPQSRRALAAACLRAGKHVLLEKPPGAAVSEIAPLLALAEAGHRTLFATWHSRFAPAVKPARAYLAGRAVRSVRIVWKEDVRFWHPGQQWIWQAGGLGVFDPGINALSILTHILPNPPFLTGAELEFPANRDAPIAARMDLGDFEGAEMRAEFDWRQTGNQTWDIIVQTDAAELALRDGGKTMLLDGAVVADAPEAEYAALYRHFLDLVARGASDVDVLPLQLVADAFTLGRRVLVDSFDDD